MVNYNFELMFIFCSYFIFTCINFIY